MGAPFWQLWWATAISSSGDGLVGTVALPLLTLSMTKNALAIAGVIAANRAAAAVASLPAGLLTDRWDRRRLMVACDVVPGAVLAGLALALTFGVADLVMVYVAAVVVAVTAVTYELALQAVFPNVVPSPGRLAYANGRMMGARAAGEQSLGPAVGGFLFGVARRLPFLADAVSFFASALLVRLNVPLEGAAGPSRDGLGNGSDGAGNGSDGRVRRADRRRTATWWQDLRVGFEVFNSKRPLQLLAAVMATTSFSQNMVFALLVVYGEHSLSLSPSGYGLFLAGASLLGVTGLFFGGTAEHRLGPSGVLVIGSLACGLSYLGMWQARWAVLAAVAFGLQELGTAIANVGSVTTRQRLIPGKLFGRVGSVHRLFVVVAAPLGALVAGVVADAWGVRATMLVAGIVELTVIALLAPAVRRHLAEARLVESRDG